MQDDGRPKGVIGAPRLRTPSKHTVALSGHKAKRDQSRNWSW